ncbi:arsenite efflux membrane protein ArsB [Scopulibacillus darangshiensis]|uniref:Arsenite efflux membrane protein ArsB n=1 Tax=Scopulibacillus darangshiensis TaxID=442528 RepID=A0A4V2SLS2_9BACL|nr:arsenic transporter [Scopulibacillus darangshiensis]TCP24506.1 arsenite efflux membrane protein ArsB [Scopulibacillus darangshiensis]
MLDVYPLLTITIFLITIFIMIWNPWKINETIPTAIGASLFLLLGIVPLTSILEIFNIVSGASVTILSTIVMSIVLESVGFFRWVAFNLVNRAKGSGVKLFVYVNLLCYLMTMFFNNDGSVLITTPILIKTVNLLNLKPHQKIPFLLSGATIATASSAPIAISNIANLIALKIVGLDINGYVAMMFIPSMIGILVIATLLFLYFKKDIPKRLPNIELDMTNYDNPHSLPHPLSGRPGQIHVDWGMFKICLGVIVIVRGSYFLLTPFGIPIEWIAIIGALVLIGIRWYRNRAGIMDVIKKTPWHILLFAFSMYILVYGLQNIGLTSYLVGFLEGIVQSSRLHAVFIMGGLLTLLSNVFNNLPSVMIGTLTLTKMNLDPHTLQIAYLANILGSDIGSLLTPIGTLATLLWMFILKENHILMSWKKYIKVTIVVIPIGLFISLISLYFWTNWLF